MSSWLAVLKIQLHPHLEGKGSGEVAVRPESEGLMPAFHCGGGPSQQGPRKGRGQDTKAACPL